MSEYTFRTIDTNGFFGRDRVAFRLFNDGNEYADITIREDGVSMTANPENLQRKDKQSERYGYLLCAIVQRIVWGVEPTIQEDKLVR